MNSTYILLIAGSLGAAIIIFLLLRPDRILGYPITELPKKYLSLRAPPSQETLEHLNRDQVKRHYKKEFGRDPGKKTKTQMIDELTKGRSSTATLSDKDGKAHLEQEDVDLRVKRVSVTYEPLQSPRALLDKVRGGSLQASPGKGRYGQRKMSALERQHLRNFANRHIGEDFDVDAEIDPELSYEENKQHLAKFAKDSELVELEKTSKKRVEDHQAQLAYQQAQFRHEMRDEQAKELDEHIQAQEQHDPGNIPEQWFRQPNQSDVPGIDDHKGLRPGSLRSPRNPLAKRKGRK